MRGRQSTFVDSGAWIALALTRDPLHSEAREKWDSLQGAGAVLHTSIPVVLETFTFLQRNANLDVAIAWKDSIAEPGVTEVTSCGEEDLERAWVYFQRRLHKLSAVDATSFAIMERKKIRYAFAFDHHFAAAGFSLVG